MPQWFVIENEKRTAHLKEIGLNPYDLVVWVQKWHSFEMHCKQFKKENELTFYTYTQLAVEAGLTSPSQIGRSKYDYQLGRYGDQGGYSITNCRFITKKENLDERQLSGAIDRAMMVRKDSDIKRRKTYKAEKEGAILIAKGLKEMSNLIGATIPSICTAAKTGRKVKGWIITQPIDISDQEIMPA